VKPIIQLFTELLGISGIVAAFGYMELRAHWTYLGVSPLPGVGVERYLMEAYAFVGAMLLPAMLCAFVLLFVALIGIWLRRRLAKTRVEGILRNTAKLLPALALVALLAGEVVLLRALTGPIGVAIGPLQTIAAEANRRGAGSVLEVVLLILLAIIALLMARPLVTGVLKWAIITVALILLVQTSTLYGRNVRSAIYPAARIKAKSETHLGLILLQTEDALELWIPAQGVGRIVVLPADDVERIDLGRGLDLFHVAGDPSPTAIAGSAGL
jgi:hypothetical protein